MNPFTKQYEGESAKHLRVLWDYFLCGQNIGKVLEKYKGDSTAPSHSYQTLSKWREKFHFDDRITAYQESLIEQEKIEFEDKRREWTKKQLDLLEAHNNAIQDCEVDLEGVTLTQYTNAVSTQIKMIQSVFNIEPVKRVAPTDPTGEKEYSGIDVSELIKLADAAKRRPE